MAKIAFILLAVSVCVWGKPVERRDPMINEGLFEGDIKGIDPTDRNAIPRDSMRWPQGVIPYVIDPSLNHLTDMIKEAMQHIQETTCIRFVERTNQRDFLRLFKQNGCWSFWGFLGTGQQDLSLGSGCEYIGTVVHELLHAIGFEHEHNRSDRDDHLIINWSNIQESWFYAFRKLRPEQNRLLSSFDFDSVMLYGQYAFNNGNGLKTMEARDGRFMPAVYDKKSMSASDITRIKMLYNC